MSEGFQIQLRPWQESDIPDLMRLRNDVALQAKLLARARGSDVQQVRKWLQERSTGIDRAFFVIAGLVDGAPLGYLQFAGMDPIDRNAELGICLAPEAQGQGIGGAALKLAIACLRETLAMRKLSLRVQADNAPAIRCYLGAGFTQCGMLRDHVFIEGAWRDVLLMELFLAPGD